MDPRRQDRGLVIADLGSGSACDVTSMRHVSSYLKDRSDPTSLASTPFRLFKKPHKGQRGGGFQMT
jgi:hypothetical protein